MTEQQLILQKLEELSKRMDDGFNGVSGEIRDLERRLGKQEKKIRKAAKEQSLQASEIEKLKKIVKDIADSDGRRYGSEVAIRKEPAYEGFEECGISKRAAMRALRDAGAIKTDSQNKTTCTIRVGGKAERVIMVFMDGADN